MTEHKHHTKKKKISPVSIVIIAFLAVLVIYSAATGLRNQPQEYESSVDMDALAQCIVNSDATFYGTEWCSHCQSQKRMLGDVFNQFRSEFYVDCDKDRGACQAAGITGYPTWVINGQKYVGTQQLETLYQATNCGA
jgi:glutaredoxin